jgi:hypothetical protein
MAMPQNQVINKLIVERYVVVEIQIQATNNVTMCNVNYK